MFVVVGVGDEFGDVFDGYWYFGDVDYVGVGGYFGVQCDLFYVVVYDFGDYVVLVGVVCGVQVIYGIGGDVDGCVEVE